MSETKKVTGKDVIDTLQAFLSGQTLEVKEEVKTEEVKEEVVMEAETKEETKEETKDVQLASELPEGNYVLGGEGDWAGTKFRIDENGNVVDVEAMDAKDAESEEEAKDVEDEMSKENLEDSKLSKATEEIEKLKAEVAELSKVEPVSNAPKKRESVKLEITPNMTYKERVMAGTLNSLNN